jgi:hypothetical protein
VENVKMDPRKIGWYGMVWYGMDLIDLAQDRDTWKAVVNMTMNLRVP